MLFGLTAQGWFTVVAITSILSGFLVWWGCGAFGTLSSPPFTRRPIHWLWSGLASVTSVLFAWLLAASVKWSVGQVIQKSPVIEIEDGTVRFARTRIGAANHSRVTVRNAGKGKLIIHSATAEPSVFTVEMEEAPIIVERGETAEITVVFRPVEGAPTNGKLVIASNDQKAGDQENDLIGSVAISTEDAIKVFDGLDSSSTVLEPK